jgi:hypothetical protein
MEGLEISGDRQSGQDVRTQNGKQDASWNDRTSRNLKITAPTMAFQLELPVSGTADSFSERRRNQQWRDDLLYSLLLLLIMSPCSCQL